MKKRLWAYTTGICQHRGIFVHSIGGMEDRIHLLLQFPPTLVIADAIRDIKSNSSGWMSSEIGRFAWQQGYGGFGVSKSNIAAVVRYIQNQEQHHAPGARFTPAGRIRRSPCSELRGIEERDRERYSQPPTE
jgi:REP element-mobilizing transposase RayT